MTINFKNQNFFKNNNSIKLSKKAKNGAIIATSLVLIGLGLGKTYNKLHNNNEFKPFVTSVPKDSLNDINIIIDDGDCSDTFFDSVCQKLEEDGLVFDISKNGSNINKDNSVVITLDQQYSSGSDTLILAANDNARLGNSDSLALAMKSALDQNGFLGNGIYCGKIGYRINENDDVSSLVPTETEEIIDDNYCTSFVTISFGTENVNSEWVAKSIENGLARYTYYLNNCDEDVDLIYRANANDDIDAIADYFGTDTVSLCDFNGHDSTMTSVDETFINPIVINLNVFDSRSMFNIDAVRTRSY